MSTLFVIGAANLFCGDHDPTNSKFLAIQELKLPAFQAEYQDHKPGGARVGMEIEVGIQKFEAGFKLTGIDMDVLTQFGLGSKIKHTYTAYAEVEDRRTGRTFELKAVIEARLGKAEMDAVKRGDLTATDYALNEISRYELWYDGKPKFRWDAWTNLWEVDGVNENSRTNAILRIAGTNG